MQEQALNTFSEPLVSVLMTAYNREKYIAEAIESVLASTYTNFELIIVDDCSKDDSVNIARSYAAKDERIKVYVNEKNLGDYPNRNRAASYAKGKYIKYVDADDLIYPHSLDIMVKNMENFPEAGWGLLSLPQDEQRPFPFMLYPEEIYRRNYIEKKMVFHKAPLSAIIRKDVFDAVNGFKDVRHYGDSELWHRLSLKYPLVLLHDGLVWWRRHEDQEAKKRKDKWWVGVETINAALENVLDKDCPLSEDDKKFVIRRLKNNHTGQILMKVKAGKFLTAYKLLKLSKKVY